MERPLLLFDRECHFCTMWVERWKEITGDRVTYRPFQEVQEGELPVSKRDLQEAIHYIDQDGKAYRGAQAVFRLLADRSFWCRLCLKAYEQIPGVAHSAEFFYRLVARNRSVFSWGTRLLCGQDLRKPTYAISTWIFLRLLGVVYLIAFWSLWVQALGLIGKRGILPYAIYFNAAREQLGQKAYYYLPSLLWFSPTDTALVAITIIGMLGALAVILTWGQRWALGICWVLYLSLVSAGQVFFSFQWDALLLETGFLSLFIAPKGWWQGMRMIKPSTAGRVLLFWLLFRLMFSSGIVKLSSGDDAWKMLTALDYHYFTQPLPNPISWYMQQLPQGFQKISVLIMFLVELVFPFFIFGPRRLRYVACLGFCGLQTLIFLTGNYGFFNLLSIALGLLLLDDRVFPARWNKWILPEAFQKSSFIQLAKRAVVTLLILLSFVPLISSFRRPLPFFVPLAAAYEFTTPFRLINGYGLFSIMTKERREIRVQGSDDGITWKDYVFPFKPGPLNRPPPWAWFYMPRLDWQMWFAALGSYRENPWFVQFLRSLLEGSPDTLHLMKENPFSQHPPRYIRAQLEDYRFTNFDQRKKTGDWWDEQPEGRYMPAASLE